MSAATTLAVNVLDPHSLLASFGAIGVGVVLFAETGLLVGYHLGARGGRVLLERTQRPKLHEAVDRAQHLFERCGHGKAIVLVRLLPVVRTAFNSVAAAVFLPPGVFLCWQMLGGLLWTVGLTVAGYVPGTSIPNIDRYLLPVIVLIAVVSLVPIALELLRAKRAP